MVVCKYCNKEYSKKGIGTHIWRMHGKGKAHDPNIGFKTRNRKIWNKGLTKKTSKSVEKYGSTLSKKIRSGEITPSFLGKTHSEAYKKKLSERLSLKNPGGKCKWFDFKKKDGSIIKVQGTWELRFARILEKIDHEFIKPSKTIHSCKWIDSLGNEHTYTPDFFSPKNNKYYEIKGFWWGDDKEKMNRVISQHSEMIIEIIRKKDLEHYENEYGT